MLSIFIIGDSIGREALAGPSCMRALGPLGAGSAVGALVVVVAGQKNGCTHAGGGCKAGSMRKGASKLDIPPLSNSVLISTDPKTSILLSNKIKQLIHIKSKQKLPERQILRRRVIR